MIQVKKDNNSQNEKLTAGDKARKIAFAAQFTNGFKFGGNTYNSDTDEKITDFQAQKMEVLLGEVAFFAGDGSVIPGAKTILFRSSEDKKGTVIC